jgi:hypothetical protein
MTAIALSYNTEGFALLADGRARRDDGFIVTDKAQKIFPVEGNSHLAYILAGNLVLGAEGTTQVLFDFSTVIREAFAAAVPAPENRRALHEYAQAVCEHVLQRFEHAQAARPFFLTGDAEPDDDIRIIARLFVVGYWCMEDQCDMGAAHCGSCGCSPAWINARFFDHGDDVLRFSVESVDINAPRALPMMYGSEIVAALFAKNDPRVAKYCAAEFSPRRAEDERLGTVLAAVWGTGGRQTANSMSISSGYIEACCDPEIAQLDPGHCAGIGGAIQIATITPVEGFVWRRKPV